MASLKEKISRPCFSCGLILPFLLFICRILVQGLNSTPSVRNSKIDNVTFSYTFRDLKIIGHDYLLTQIVMEDEALATKEQGKPELPGSPEVALAKVN